MSQIPRFLQWDSETEETGRLLAVIEIRLAPSGTTTEDFFDCEDLPSCEGIVNGHLMFQLHPKDFTAELPAESDPHGTWSYWLYDGESPGEERWDELARF